MNLGVMKPSSCCHVPVIRKRGICHVAQTTPSMIDDISGLYCVNNLGSAYPLQPVSSIIETMNRKVNHGIVVPIDRSIAIRGVLGGLVISTDSMLDRVDNARIMRSPIGVIDVKFNVFFIRLMVFVLP